MKTIKVEDSVGMVLCHDITKIVPGEFKGRAFKKGHIIRDEDIPVLLSLGKDHIYVWDMDSNDVHENEAESVAQAVRGAGIINRTKEGAAIAEYDGMITIDEDLLYQINLIDDMSWHQEQLQASQKGVVAGVVSYH